MSNLIKIFDEETALALNRRGFSYVTERINEEQEAYVFENSEELRIVLAESFGLAEVIEDDMLRFGEGGRDE